MATRKKRTAPATPPAKRRKGFLAVAIPWLKRFGIILGGLIFMLWLVAWGMATGAFTRAAQWGENQILSATANAGFEIKNILVEGRTNTDPALLMALLNIQQDDPLFSVKPNNAKDLLESTKWIKHAYIQRRLPDTIYIKLTERTPTAILKTKNGSVLLDQDSTAIEVEDISAFTGLITLSGAGAQDAMQTLITTIQATPSLSPLITKAQRLGQRRWDITLNNGIILKLPEDNTLAFALERAEKAEKHDQIFEIHNVKSIDLRFTDKLLIQTSPGSVIDYKRGLSDKNTNT